MSKKKWKQETDELYRRVLELLKLNEGRSFSQKDIQLDFFAVFRDAYIAGYCCPLRHYFYIDTGEVEWIWPKSKPMISGDTIWQYACKHGWVHSEMLLEEDRYQDIRRVRDWWDAWTFAWEQLGYKKRCHRNKQAAS